MTLRQPTEARSDLRVGDPPATSSARLPPGRLASLAIILLVTFLLVFPKGGIKLAGVPITWGYLLLGIAWLAIPVALILGGRWTISHRNLLAAAALTPFQLVVWLSFIVNGVLGMGFAISLLVTFFVIPYAFLLVLGPAMARLDPTLLFRTIRAGVLLVAVYGIFLFFYRLFVGSFIEIPFLTVNAGDLGELEDKYIDRGGVFKLISTYNNGNIYGVSMLLLLPLYTWLERRPVPTLVVKASLLLTLSRTVWAGLLVYEVLQRTYTRRIQAKTLFILIVSLGVLIAGIFAALNFMKFDTAFLFDPKLGARLPQVEAMREATILPHTSFEHILEMVYFSVVSNFGLIGLVSFCFAMFFPLGLYFLKAVPNPRSGYKKSLAVGLMVYLFVASGDGALLFIPVMAFFWFVVMLLLSEIEPAAPSVDRRPGLR